jgi:hypothetical protein
MSHVSDSHLRGLIHGPELLELSTLFDSDKERALVVELVQLDRRRAVLIDTLAELNRRTPGGAADSDPIVPVVSDYSPDRALKRAKPDPSPPQRRQASSSLSSTSGTLIGFPKFCAQ